MEADGGESENDVPLPPEPFAKWRNYLAIRFRYYLDRSAPHIFRRWVSTLVVAMIYILRVYYVKGFHVISYALATYVLNMVIGFLSPKADPELQEGVDGTNAVRRDSLELKPFARRLPEFKFWCSVTKAFLVSFIVTFVSLLDVPVFWPILLSYWLFLFAVTMKRLIVDMWRYQYNPFKVEKLRSD